MSRLSPAAIATALPFAGQKVLPRVLHLLKSALRLTEQRRDLAGLDETRLADIGLTRAEAQAEAARPFWDVPAHWR